MPEENREKKEEQKPFKWRSFVLQSALGNGVKNILGAVVLIVVILGAWYVLVSNWGQYHSRERARRVYCMNNLKMLGIGLARYAEEHDKAYPPDLQTLYNRYVADTDLYICHSSWEKRAEGVTPTDYATGKVADIPAMNMSYCYVAGLKSTDPENYIVIFEPDGNHNMDGVNALYVGQNVKWQTDIKAVHEQLAKQEGELKAQGREMRIIRPGESDKK